MYKQRIDALQVNRSVDLLSLAGSLTDLGNRQAASTGGGEWKGPCPFCGLADDDGFAVQPYQQPKPLWMCRKCTGAKWCDAIEFGRRLWPGLSFPEICERLTGGRLPTTNASVPAPKPEPKPAAQPPSAEWQAAARQVIAEAQATLWQPRFEIVREYLHSRGLTDETIVRFGLGYCSTGRREQSWRKIAGLQVPRGIIIPGTHYDELWYLKVRMMPGVPVWCKSCERSAPGPGDCPRCGRGLDKYKFVPGSHASAVFNAEMLETSDYTLFVEGEFDAMLAWQEFRDVLPTATIGSANNRVDLATWGRYFLAPGKTLILPDNDEAGEQFTETIMSYSPRYAEVGLTDKSKDITEFYQAGGNLSAWALEQLNHFAPLEDKDMLTLAQSVGAAVTELQTEPGVTWQKDDYGTKSTRTSEIGRGRYAAAGPGVCARRRARLGRVAKPPPRPA